MGRSRQEAHSAEPTHRTWRTAAAILALSLAFAAPAAEEARPPDGESAATPSVRRVLALEGDPEAGERIYRTCAVCHRADGGGRPDGTFPQLAGQHGEVVVKQLVDIREGRRHNPVMEPWAEHLVDDQDVADVAAYVETLPVPARPDPAAEPAEAPDGVDGAALYGRDCRSCHGARGQGDAQRFVPVLAHQHERYLLRQIRAIAGGRRENAHPAMERIVEHYTDAQLRAVVRHAAALPGPEREP